MKHLQHRAESDHDRGSISLELVIIAPAFLLIVAALIFAGRVELAKQSVNAAASDAARTASIARTQDTANGTARSAATSTLASQGIRCVSTTVSVDTSGFGAPVGTPATVTATVSCTVNLSDLSAPGIPGTKLVSATATSPLDTFRER
jgi:Flp pilus assembly protein TadG